MRRHVFSGHGTDRWLVESDASPTRASTPIHDYDDLQLVGQRRPSSQVAVADSTETSRRVSVSKRSHTSDHERGNATLLTECSFGVAHDKLVQVITDAQPFEPHWEDLSSIDLSKKALDSVARLKEFLPKLDALTLCVVDTWREIRTDGMDRNGNQLAWLSGLPGSLRTLGVASNAYVDRGCKVTFGC